ncbi:MULTISPECIES: flavin reductase family protein [unclassified Streptococcus]|uniref:flavin reductase family protein n=1 Tax=unclassified Streptococcus TaxID=2608887 RepID=UPI0010727E1E|nr:MULTISPECIES: flavin reductase family protein [unclassified Streptococcus]MBF0805552.1 flavin reductase family protein [Streptococcus sp. 19428wA2_WM07]TFU28921.1 flavin reductase family protein [Streptococcus sp. WM07]
MKNTFDTRKLYFGFPVFFLGYKDEIHGYNITTSSSVYSLGRMVVIGMRTKSNSMQHILKTGEFTINVPQKDLLEEVEVAGFNSKKDKFDLTKLVYSLAQTVDAPLVDACPVSIECKVVDKMEFGALTNVVAEVTRRVVDEQFVDADGYFRNDQFNPVLYIGDGHERLYRSLDDESVKMGSLIENWRQKNM